MNEVKPKTIKLHLQSQEYLLHTQVHLAPVVAQQAAAVKIPMSKDRRPPIWPWLLMMMNSLMTHTRSFLLRMPLLFLSRQGMEGFNRDYLLPAEVTAFQGIYYHKSGDVRPGYTGASPWDFPLDHQGHMTLKLHSGVAAYSLYIGLVSTGIVYAQQEDPDIKIDHYNYFNIIGTVPPPANHGIWDCLHYLPLVSNVFLAQYDSETFLSHLTDRGMALMQLVHQVLTCIKCTL